LKQTSLKSRISLITVNNKDFDLEWVRWYDGLTNVEVGDSVMKKKGNQWMEIIKSNNINTFNSNYQPITKNYQYIR